MGKFRLKHLQWIKATTTGINILYIHIGYLYIYLYIQYDLKCHIQFLRVMEANVFFAVRLVVCTKGGSLIS